MVKGSKKQKRAKAKALKARKNLQNEAVFEQAMPVVSSRDNSVSESTPVLKVGNRPCKAISSELLWHASCLFAFVAGTGLLMMFAAFYLPEGVKAVRAASGFPESGITVRTAQIIMALDTLFPIFLLSGTAVLATALQTRGNRPLVRMILTTLLFVMIFDMAENALVYAAISNGEVSSSQFPLTVAKYGGLALASILFSVILPMIGKFGTAIHIFLRYLIPISTAILATGLGDQLMRDAITAGSVITIFAMAVYPQVLAEPQN